MNDMKQFLLKLNKKYPGAIDLFIDHLKGQKQTKNRLFMISILCAFREHTESWKDIFADIYERYTESNFISKKLNDEDKDFIATRYIEEIEKIRKEVLENAI